MNKKLIESAVKGSHPCSMRTKLETQHYLKHLFKAILKKDIFKYYNDEENKRKQENIQKL